MAIGTITSPAAWVNGAPVGPAWLQQVQDNENGWIAGTGPTLKALQVDGVGGNSSAAASGSVVASGPVSGLTLSTAQIKAGQSLPTAAITRGTAYLESILYAAGVFDGSGVITFSSGLNLQSITRSGTGVYVVTLATTATSSLCISATVIAVANVIANVDNITTTSFRLTCKTTAGAAADCGIHFQVFQL